MINSMLKVTGGVAGAASVGGLVNEWAVALFDVPLTVVLMALFGAVFSYGIGKNTDIRGLKLYFQVIAFAFASIVVVSVIPDWFGLTWATPKIEAPLAGIVGLVARFAWPALYKLFPALASKWLGVENKKDSD